MARTANNASVTPQAETAPLRRLDRRRFLLGAAALGLTATAFGAFSQALARPGRLFAANGPISASAGPRPESLVEPFPDTTEARIGHLLRRAGFGAGRDELHRFIKMGLDRTVEHLIDYQGVDDSALEKRLDAMGLDIIEKPGQLMQWWMLRMAYTARPLQEKMTLFWHGLLTSAFTKVGKGSAMFDQNQLYRENALGKYDVLLRAVSRDPAMLIYLDSARNRKQAPNENFARELMELFTMGEGNYTEQDVRESARAFTGWGLQKREFVFRRQWHDYGLKRFLGRQGDLDGDDVIDTIMMQPVTADYITRRLFSFFAYDDPDDLTVERLAGKFRNGGYSVKPVMEDILTSDEFYSDRASRAKIKSPIELVAGTYRILGIDTGDKPIPVNLDALGQMPFNPPNVASWPGGASWINSNTLLERVNFAHDVARRSGRFLGQHLPTGKAGGSVTADFNPVDYFGALLLDGNIPPDDREALTEFVGSIVKGGAGSRRSRRREFDALTSVVYLLLSSPAYHLA